MRCFDSNSGPALVGVIHLLPLPGSPVSGPGIDVVESRAVQDAKALVAGGVDGIILENFGDAPFASNKVAPQIVAYMTRIALAVRAALPNVTLGINVLRNDASAALAVAAASNASFIRVNIHTGTMVTDQGVITGCARETLLQRQRYGLDTKIAADVHVKHANPLGQSSLVQSAKDTVLRGHANAIIITGSGTGEPVNPEELQTLRHSLPHTPIWIGSGLNPENAETYRGLFHTAIVGTYLHEDKYPSPVDPKRVEIMRQSLDA